MELPAQSPEVTKQVSGAGLRRRGNTGTSCESQAPTCSALPGANSQGQDGLPGAYCREACSLVWGLLHLGFGGALRQISGVSEYREDVTGWQQQGRGSWPLLPLQQR